MKKLLFLVTSFILGIVLIGCSSASKTEKKGIDVDKLDPSKPVTVKVGATNVPHAVLLEHVAPQLEKEGISRLRAKIYELFKREQGARGRHRRRASRQAKTKL